MIAEICAVCVQCFVLYMCSVLCCSCAVLCAVSVQCIALQVCRVMCSMCARFCAVCLQCFLLYVCSSYIILHNTMLYKLCVRRHCVTVALHKKCP